MSALKNSQDCLSLSFIFFGWPPLSSQFFSSAPPPKSHQPPLSHKKWTVPYADDTTAFATGNSVDRVIQLLNVLPKEIIQWCRVNRLTIHWGKGKTMIITKQRFIGPLQQVKCGDVVLDFTEVAKCSPNLARILSYWTDDDKMTSKVQSGCRLLNR